MAQGARSWLTACLVAVAALVGCDDAVADGGVPAIRDLWRQGDLKQALGMLETRVAESPQDARARLLLADVYLDLFQGDRAEQELLLARAAGVEPERTLLPLLRALLSQGAHLRMLDEIARASFPDPERQAELEGLRGSAYLGVGDAHAAGAAFDAARALIPGQLDALVGQARLALAVGRAAEARSLLVEATIAHPESAAAWERLADLDYGLGDYVRAEQSLVKAEVAARNKWMPRFKRALVRLQLGQMAAAASDLDAVEADLPNFPALQLGRGLLMLKQGLVHRGIESIQAYLSYDPENLLAILALADAEIARDNLAAGEELLRRYLRARPRAADANLRLARLFLRQGKPAAAEQLLMPLAASATLTSSLPAALPALLAETLSLQGRPAEARHWFRRAIELDPDQADYRVAAAGNLMDLGDADAALAELETALESDPLNRAAQLVRVKILMTQGSKRRALDLAETLAELRRDDAAVLNALGLARLGSGALDAARDAFEEALSVQPGHADAALNLSSLRLRADDLNGARAVLEAFLDARPGHTEAILALAALDARDGGPSARQQRLEAAVGSHPEDLDLLLALARAYLDAAQPQRARTLLLSAPDQLTASPRLLAMAGESQMATGDMEQAIKTYQQVLLRSPKDAAAHYQLARAYAETAQLEDMEASLVDGLAAEPDHPLRSRALDAALAADVVIDSRIALLERLTASVGEHPALLERRAEQLYRRGALNDALLLLEALQAKDAEDRVLMRKRAAVQYALGDVDGYLRTISDWTTGHPSDSGARLMLAQALESLDRLDDARAILEGLMEERPGDPLVMNNLAWLLRDSEPERALLYAERANRLMPGDAAIMDTLGALLNWRGDLERALELLEGARAAEPADPDIALHYAEALIAAGRNTEARVLLLDLTRKPFSGEQRVRELLDELGG